MAGYRVIATDGREYGPVAFDQLRRWIGEGRVHANTLVRPEGSMEWRPLGTFPELRPFVSSLSLPNTATTPSSAGLLRTNPWAVWGFVLGVLSVTLCSCCCLPVDLLGIVFSIIALVQINKQPQTQSGNTLAILGLVLSALSFVTGLALSAFWMSGTAMEEMMRGMERAR